MRLGIIGGGRAAWAFASAWRSAGAPVSGIALRTGSESPLPRLLALDAVSVTEVLAASDVVVVAVSDKGIPALAAEIARLHTQPAVFHCSGSLPSSVFGSRSNAFSLHPFRALPAVGEPMTLRGTLMVYEGPEGAMAVAREIVATCGALFGRVSADEKPRYHAAAVFAANYVAAMLQISEEILTTVGLTLGDAGAVPKAAIREAVVDLAASAATNWLHQRGAAAFTGPAARGEREVVAGHLGALADVPDVAGVYRQLASVIVQRTSGRRGGDGGD